MELRTKEYLLAATLFLGGIQGCRLFDPKPVPTPGPIEVTAVPTPTIQVAKPLSIDEGLWNQLINLPENVFPLPYSRSLNNCLEMGTGGLCLINQDPTFSYYYSPLAVQIVAQSLGMESWNRRADISFVAGWLDKNIPYPAGSSMVETTLHRGSREHSESLIYISSLANNIFFSSASKPQDDLLKSFNNSLSDKLVESLGFHSLLDQSGNFPDRNSTNQRLDELVGQYRRLRQDAEAKGRLSQAWMIRVVPNITGTSQQDLDNFFARYRQTLNQELGIRGG